MTPFAKELLITLIRQGLKLGGLAYLFTDSQLEQGLGAVSLMVGLGMSAYNAWVKHHGETADAG